MAYVPTSGWARWDLGNASLSHFGVTMYVLVVGVASGEMVALISSFDTNLVGNGWPLSVTRWNGHIA